MGETPSSGAGTREEQSQPKSGIEELASIAGDVQRTVLQSTDSALRSLQQNSSSHLRSLQDFIPQLKSQYQAYEDALLKKVKDEMTSAREHPAAATGIAVMASLLLLRGPRRFLFRQTLGQFQSEEAQFVKAEKSVKELGLSVDLLKKESKKLLERAALAEREMKNGHTALMVVENDIHHLVKSVYKAEAQATNLMDFLREIPRREALKMRAEVASVASLLRQKRMAMDKQMKKITEHTVSI